MINIPDEIKALLHKDTCKKNIRIHFPNGERTDICNDLIVKDTVSFKESLCSQDTLKFGLCEAPVFECETVGVGNIKGATIQVFCEIYCEADYANIPGAIWQSDLMAHVYQIPLGTFVVASCQRQGDIIHRKIVAYGGCNALNTVDPTIKAKETYRWLNDNRDYSFNIFATALVNSSIVGRLDNATYTEVAFDGASYDDVNLYYTRLDPEVPPRYYEYICLRIRYMYKVEMTEDINRVYYAEHGEPTYQNINEVLSVLLRQAKDDPDIRVDDDVLDEYFENLSKTRYFQEYTNPIGVARQGGDGMKMAWGAYAYPYQFSDSGLYQTLKMPYSIGIGYHKKIQGQSTGTSHTTMVQFNDSSEYNLYQVDISNYPTDVMSYPRVLSYEDVYHNKYYSVAENIDYYGLTEAMSELYGVFFNIRRNSTIKLLNIKQQFALLPSNTLYPESSLYPGSPTGASIRREDYQSCWYDDEYTKPFGAVTCQYKNSDNEDAAFTLYLDGFDENTPHENYQIYDLSGNTIINMTTWTESQIEAICERIAANIEGVKYIPVSFVGRGLPYVEAGDTFEILTGLSDSITTIVLNRTLTGDQTLTDSYKSTGTDTGIY